jgi:nitrile hydratase accessory protein
MPTNEHIQTSGLPHDGEGPVFREPWEASAFAIAVKLNEAGYFSWPEWVDYLAAEIQAADTAHGRRSDICDESGHEYYRHWFAALEKLIVAKEIVDEKSINTRHQHLKDNPAPHDHLARREPIKVAPGR